MQYQNYPTYYPNYYNSDNSGYYYYDPYYQNQIYYQQTFGTPSQYYRSQTESIISSVNIIDPTFPIDTITNFSFKKQQIENFKNMFLTPKFEIEKRKKKKTKQNLQEDTYFDNLELQENTTIEESVNNEQIDNEQMQEAENETLTENSHTNEEEEEEKKQEEELEAEFEEEFGEDEIEEDVQDEQEYFENFDKKLEDAIQISKELSE